MPDRFRILLAPRLEDAFAALVGDLDAAPLPPTVRETVLIARESGLRVWLEQRLARHAGCAAALDVRAPRGLVANLARLLVPASRTDTDDAAHPYDAEALAWRLARLLADLPDTPPFAPLHAYLDRNPDGAAALAGVLAQRYDDYQLYRPETLAAWREERRVHPDWPHEAWQMALWKRLHEDVRAPGGSPILDRAETLLRLEHVLEAAHALPETVRALLPARVSVFGARVLPPVYYRILRALGRVVPVTAYAVAPGLRAEACAEGMGGDDAHEPIHPLARACGAHQRAFAAVLRTIGAPRPETLPPETLPPGGAAHGASGTALRRLQDALCADAPPDAPQPIAPADASLRVLDTHSPLRELEVLRDELLDAFAALPDLRPHDVLVVVPDLALYAPLVDAVFGADALPGPTGGVARTGDSPSKDVRLPYHVAGHPHAPPLRVLEAFTAALRLPDGRLGAADVLDLLDYPAVARAAGLREDDVPRLRGWIAEAGVRWGRGANDRAAHDLPPDALHTWQFGLERLVLGYALGNAGPALGGLPCDAPGLGGADTLGRFAEWLHRLLRRLDALARPRPLGAWPDALLAFADAFLDARDDDEVDALVFLRATLAAVAALAGAQPDDAPVGLRAVRAHLERTLRAYDTAEPYLTGAITFAAPFPLHHTPHRVVAFLGLGAAGYPGRDAPPTFDLLAHDPRPGDAAPREAEQQLFLDALLAARDRLVLSFVGRSQKDNAERAASVVLDAFLDACDTHFGPDARARIVRRHRLQPFSPAYFGEPAEAPGAAPLFSYAAHLLPPRDARREPPFVRLRPRPADALPEQIELRALADAWADPAAFWARRTLGLRLTPPEQPLSADEPVVLEGLDGYGVRSAVLEALLAGEAPEACRERLRLAGLLPAGALGRTGFAWLLREVAPLAAQAMRLSATGGTAPPVAVPVAFEAESAHVHGTLGRVGPEGAVRLRAGRVRPQDLAAAWVEHVALNAAADLDGRLGRATHVLGTRGSVRLSPLPEGEAALWLAALVRGYGCLASEPPPLFPAASHAYVAELGKNRSQLGALTHWLLDREKDRREGKEPPGFNPELSARGIREAQKRFEGGFGERGDRAAPHAALVARDTSPFEDARAFARWSAALWAPILHYRTEVR